MFEKYVEFFQSESGENCWVEFTVLGIVALGMCAVEVVSRIIRKKSVFF